MCASEPDKNYSLTTGTVTGSPNDLPTASATHEQAVNTDPWTEEKAVVTDPMTESRGVGTEWSDSSMESESESESEAESDSRLSTPHAAAPEHFSDSPSPKHDILTPVPSLTQITGLTPVPSLTPSPLHSHTFLTPSGTPAHTTNPDRSTTHMEDSFAQHNFSVEEEDPLVNQHVLARWPDDGWYYRGLVRQSLGEMWYQVQDASLDVETIYASDIIIDLQDAQKPLTIGDTVAALHPSYGYSYAPGKVTGMASDGFHFAVELYDGTKTFLPRQEIYSLARAKQQQDIEYLWRKEKEWVGLAVMVRRDRDGLYLPGKVVKQLAGPCQYLIRWTNGSTQAQTVTHMFGKLTKKRGLRQGDHVLALAIPNQGVFMPGTIQEKVGQNLQVEFCDGQSSLVDPFKCFWISSEYYQEAVKFIADSVSSSSATSVSSLKTEDLESAFSSITKSDKMSEYTAS